MDDALALLRLQIEWGADEAIADEPFNRFSPIGRTAGPEKPVVRPAAPVLVRDVPLPRTGTAGERALADAGRAGSVDELRAAIAAFDGCALRDTASNLVFAEGDPSSPTLIVGDPPGREEDRGGHPFAGPEGALLDQMLASVGLERSSLMLTPLVPWRPPGGRPVNPGELALCLPFLHRLIGLMKPRRLVIFGATAARALVGQPITRRRGPRGWLDAGIPAMPDPVPCLALPGMSDMLKNPPLRRDAWTGLRLLRRALDDERTGG